MTENLTLTVSYEGEELELPAKMYPYGYTFRVEVEVDEHSVIFEPDEEEKYRALVDTGKIEQGSVLNIRLLQAIAEKLEKPG